MPWAHSNLRYSFAGMAVAILLANVSPGATLPILNDRGLLGGVRLREPRADIFTWSADGPQATFVNVHQFVSGSPEGRSALLARVTNGWGGFGIFFIRDSRVATEYDLSSFTEGEVHFWLQSSNNLSVGIEFVDSGGIIRLGSFPIPSTTNRWTAWSVPLADFTPPINLRRVRSPFLVTAASGLGSKIWHLDDIRWQVKDGNRSTLVSTNILLPAWLANMFAECREVAQDIEVWDGQGRACRISTANATITTSYGRPSSGQQKAILDLKTGVLTDTWGLPGLGHGNIRVVPVGDGRFAERIEWLAASLQRWTTTARMDWSKNTRLFPDAQARRTLEQLSIRLLRIASEFPLIVHSPQSDVLVEEDPKDTNTVSLRLRCRLERARDATVAYMARDAEDKSWTFDDFALLVPRPRSLDAQQRKDRLARMNMSSVAGAYFEAVIKVERPNKHFYYVITAQSDDQLSRTACLLNEPFHFAIEDTK